MCNLWCLVSWCFDAASTTLGAAAESVYVCPATCTNEAECQSAAFGCTMASSRRFKYLFGSFSPAGYYFRWPSKCDLMSSSLQNTPPTTFPRPLFLPSLPNKCPLFLWLSESFWRIYVHRVYIFRPLVTVTTLHTQLSLSSSLSHTVHTYSNFVSLSVMKRAKTVAFFSEHTKSFTAAMRDGARTTAEDLGLKVWKMCLYIHERIRIYGHTSVYVCTYIYIQIHIHVDFWIFSSILRKIHIGMNRGESSGFDFFNSQNI